MTINQLQAEILKINGILRTGSTSSSIRVKYQNQLYMLMQQLRAAMSRGAYAVDEMGDPQEYTPRFNCVDPNVNNSKYYERWLRPMNPFGQFKGERADGTVPFCSEKSHERIFAEEFTGFNHDTDLVEDLEFIEL